MGAGLLKLSTELADLVDAAAPSVVRVEGRRTPSSGVVWASDGLLLATHHAIDADEGVPVGLHDGQTLPARVVGRDPGSDLALLRVEASGLLPPRWRTGVVPRPGELAVSITRPGRSARARLGVVSAVGGEWRSPAGGRLESYLETDVPLHAGFSGGLLLAAEGDAYGVNTGGLLRGAALAIGAETARRVAEALLAHGRLRRGWLGLGTQPVPLPHELRERAGQRSGLIVLSVQPGGPAARAGVALGDVLLRAGEHALGSPAALLPLLDEDRIGRPLALQVLRGGEERALEVVVGERGAS